MKLIHIFIEFIIVFLLLLVGLFIFITLFSSKQFLNIYSQDLAIGNKNSWILLEQNTKAELGVLLSVLATDSNLRDEYLLADREKLYRYVQPIFETFKKQYQITHWYFILPDGKIFLRVHNKDLFGDSADGRKTFQQAEETQKLAHGIELGGTSFAFRVVVPFFDSNNKLIGYLELAKDMNHLLLPLESVNGNKVALFADKASLNKDAWAQAMRNSGAPNTWDDLKNYIIVNTFGQSDFFTEKCFTENSLENMKDKLINFEIAQGKKTFFCNGFPINDIMGNQIGALLSLTDATNQSYVVNRSNVLFLGLMFIFFIIITLVLILGFFGIFIRPIGQLTNVVVKITEGDFSSSQNLKDISGKSEIGTLARAFRVMLGKIQHTQEHLEQQVRERTAELEEKNKQLEKSDTELKKALELSERTNRLMVGRELEMIELKKKIKELKGKLGEK